MKILKIHGDTGSSVIRVGETLERLDKYIPPENVVIITDINVKNLYGHKFPPHPVITVETGEKIKTLHTVEYICEELVALGADRSTFIVGIGGGIVCDITGFVASIYLRGVRFGFVSSTLLSQVDASVGGKNGVNFKGYKNMIGVFSQPEFVICDLNLLKTLPKKEILCGLAEIVKHAVIGDADLFTYLEEQYKKALDMDMGVVEKLVYESESIVIKSGIVNRDELEKGERRKLNFGHTFGHAIEKTTGVPHGEAVSAGMVIASALSVKRGFLPAKDGERIKNLLRNLRLPTHLKADRKMVLDALKKDKKRQGDRIYFVWLNEIGNAFVDRIPMGELEADMEPV
ncbi:MAG: 3-dehydroquinate synthase [Deltaproteobacteria bacterium]|nr:3-dehydroquinate synthase [Deltaproteobacteria bacterium]